MPPIYDVPVDNSGTPVLIGNLVYDSMAWDARLVLTAGTQWNAIFDAITFIGNQSNIQADAVLNVYSGYSTKFDALFSVPSFGSFDAKYGIAIGTAFDASLAVGSGVVFDAAFGIGVHGSTIADAAVRIWNLGSKATLYGYFLRPNGTPISGIGTLRISAPARFAGSIVMPAPVPVEVQSNGFFTLQLHPNADLTPPTTVYLLTLDKWTFIFRVPRLGSVWLHQLDYLQLADPIFFQEVITSLTTEGRKTYIVVRVGTKVFKLPAEPL